MTRELPDAVCNEVRDALNRFLASRPDLTFADLTQHTTLADCTLRSFARGTIPGGKAVIAQVRKVLGAARSGEVLAPNGDGNALVVTEDHAAPVRRVAKRSNFYTTQTVKRVAEVLEFVIENCSIGVITGAFGLGKTEAVNAWRRTAGRNTETLYFEFDEFSSCNKVDFIQAIARMLGVRIVIGEQNGGKVFRDVCEHLREHPCLLIFDQCETVRVRICQVIRQIWDRTHDAGVAVVLLAAPILMQRLTGSRAADLGALTSRVGVWAPLAGLSKQEMAAIVRQEGITDVDEAAFDLWWRATGGSMRRLMRAIDLLKAKHAGKRVTARTISGMAGHLWGLNIATEEAA